MTHFFLLILLSPLWHVFQRNAKKGLFLLDVLALNGFWLAQLNLCLEKNTHKFCPGTWFLCICMAIGIMHLAVFLGECLYYGPSLVLENTFKSGNPPSENQDFSTFQIPLEPRWRWQILIFKGGEFPFLKMKPKRGLGCNLGYSPRIIAGCIRPI